MADNKYKLQFTLSNGETINAGEIVAPQGPKGDKGDKGDSADIPYSSSTPFMDGVGSVGSANTVARGDHRHPSDTSRQEKLVSGENIKTINGQSVLGSGDIPISGDIPANINTFTEVHDVLTLTASDTLNTLSAKIVALGQSVIHVRANDTARAQVDRIMGNPSTGGPPTSYCDYWFKVLSEHLIYVLFGYGGEWGIINYLYNSAKHSPNEWSMCPRWMPIDPSKIAGGTADPLTLANGLNIGTLGSDNEMPAYLKLTTSGIAYMLGSSAVSNALFSGGPIGNVKTINGQSIYGTGDITFYAHNISVVIELAIDASFSFQIISSSNLNVNSLANLETLLKSNNQVVPAWGNCDMASTSSGFVQAVSRVNVYYIRADYLKTGDPSLVTKSWTTLTNGKDVSFTDYVEIL